MYILDHLFQLFLYNPHNKDRQFISYVSKSRFVSILSRSRFVTRLLRLEPRFAILTEKKDIIFSYNRSIFKLNHDSKLLSNIYTFKNGMKNPLSASYTYGIKDLNDGIYFGDYIANFELNEVNVYKIDCETLSLKTIYVFEKGLINHIHAIIQDKYRSVFWILTGDTNQGSGIWYTDDNFQSVKKLLTGMQKYRACNLFIYEDYLVYATDSPNQDNFLYKITSVFNHNYVEEICQVNGPSIYGAILDNKDIFISTSVEYDSRIMNKKLNLITYRLGNGVKSRFSEVLYGNLYKGFKVVMRFKKDIYPMGLLQFGSISFITKPDGSEICFYHNAVKKFDGSFQIIRKVT